MKAEAVDLALEDNIRVRTESGFADCPDLKAIMESKAFMEMLVAYLLFYSAEPTTKTLTTLIAGAFLAGVRCGRADIETRVLEGLL